MWVLMSTINVLLFLALGNPAECVDWAAFSYYAAEARDAGMPHKQYRDSVISIASRVEFSDRLRELPYALTLLDNAFASKLSPEGVYQKTLKACQGKKSA